MSDFFSAWCAECVAGDYRDHVTGSHQRHVREQQAKLRAHLAQRFPWRWQQEPPVPGKTTQGERSLAQNPHPAEQIHTEPDETADDQPMS